MPIPKPRDDESQDDFMSRCMSDETMNDEYPDQDQRAAVCNQSWEDRNKEYNKMDKIIKIFDSFEVKETKDDRTLQFIGSKEITDRDKEIVKVKGLDLKNYKTNPVVLWSHQYDQPPVAKATKVWKSGDELKFKVKFAEMEEYGFADTVYKLYKGGYMNAVSIGFIPDWDSIEYPNKDGKSRSGAQRIFNKAELIELSLVPVGANPAALLSSKGITKALEDNVIDDSELEEIKLLLEELATEEILEKQCDECGEENCDCELLNSELSEREQDLLRVALGYTKIYCSQCSKLLYETEEEEEKDINIDDGDNYIDELLTVLRSEKEQKEKQKDEVISELIQILKEEK